MKIALSIYKISTLKRMSKLIDSAILMVKNYSQIYENDFNLDEAIEICKKNNIEIIISVSRIFMENELDEIKNFIYKYPYKFLVSDLGVVQILKDLNREKDIIFDSSTMVCNKLDLSIYSSFGFDAVSMSNEIPINDVKNAYKATKAPIFYQIFGRKMMFYSKRKLLKCYENKSQSKFDRFDLFIKEEKRDELMPIIENDNGFFVYRSYYLSLIQEIKSLQFLKYAYFESLTLSDDQIEEILTIYNKYLSEEISLDIATENINKLSLKIENGFIYSDSIHIKEKIIHEEN